MNGKKLEQFLPEGEGQCVEFKESLRLLNEIGECISAFSNSNNGVILVGVSDSGKVVGASVGKNSLEELAGFIKRNTDSAVFPRIVVEGVQGKKVVVVSVGECSEKPVFFRKEAFERVGKTNQKLSASEIRKLAKESGERIYWDERICREAGLKEIDEEKVKWFLKTAKERRGFEIEYDSIEEALRKLKLLKNEGLTNACFLMFAKDPQKFFLQDEAKCGRFKGTTTKEFIDMNEFSGPAFEQVDDVEKFVLKNIKRAAWIEPGKVKRQEKWEYPMDSVREAITNAIVHRDYQSPSKVQVRIFDDRIEVWNPGSLPKGWTVKTLKEEHESIPSNPLLARMFFLIKYIEEWGRGTTDMVKDCSNYGLPEPEFKDTGTSIVVIFRKSKLTEEHLEKMKLNDRQKEIINYLKEHKKMTSTEYAERFNITKRTALTDLKGLVKKGIATAKGKTKKKRHYVLTEI